MLDSFGCGHIRFGTQGDRACSCHAAGRGGGCGSVISLEETLTVKALAVKYVPTHVSTVIHVVVSTMCRLMCQRSLGCSKRTWCQLCPDAGHHIRYFVKSRDIVRSMHRDFFVFKGRVCRLCGKHVRWFSLHSKFIFLEGCRVTSRSWAENVIKTNKKGVYPPTLFEGWWVNGFCALGDVASNWCDTSALLALAAQVRCFG